ncbi:MAG: acyltransferase [Bacteroidaceae bacterium]|nr:acyltransferase [Bacteroidaceae bacterium]
MTIFCKVLNYLRTLYYKKRFFSFGKKSRIFQIGDIIHPECISIGCNVMLQDYIYMTAWPQTNEKEQPMIIIGNDCCFGAFNHITTISSIIIGNGLLTGKFVTITDNSHGKADIHDMEQMPIKRKMASKGSIFIGDNVWIGDKATILPGVSIGDGVIIAANSVVTKDIPSFCVAAGVPAKIIKRCNNK